RQRRKGDQPDKGSFELANVRLDLSRNVHRDVVRQRHRFGFRFLLEDGHASFKIRRLDVRGQSPFEQRSKALLERRDLVWRAVAAEHDLLLRIVKRVKRMKELRL